MPYVIEPAAGLTRSLMAFLVEAYTEDEAPNTKGGVDTRTVLRLDPRLAPVKAAVLPLSRNERALAQGAATSPPSCARSWNVDFDDAGAIGRRYRRQDEIGTPFCLTVDFDTLDDQAVTIRERDTMTQERVGARPGRVLPRPAARRVLTREGAASADRGAPPPSRVGAGESLGNEAVGGCRVRSRGRSRGRP